MSSFFSSDLLSYLPDSTLGFWVIDTQTEAYKAFRQGNSSDALGLGSLALSGDGEIVNFSRSFARALTASGLLSSETGSSQSLKQLIGFVSDDSNSKQLAAGVALTGVDGINMRDKFSAIQAVLRADNIPFTTENFSNAPSMVVKFNTPYSPSFSQELHFAATTDRIFITTTKDLRQALLAKNFTSGIQKLRALPAFSLIESAVPHAHQVSFGFLDIKHLIASLGAMHQNSELSALEGTFPLNAAGYMLTSDESARSTLILSTTASTEDQRRWLGSLPETRMGEPLKFASPKSDLALYLDGSFLSGAKSAALGEVSSGASSAIQSAFSVLEGATSLTITLLPPAAGSPISAVACTFKVPNAEQAVMQIKDTLSSAIKDLGGAAVSWKERTFRGLKGAALQSPLSGIEFSIGIAKEKIIFASSEEAFLTQLETVTSGQGVLASMPKHIQDALALRKPLVAAFINQGFSGEKIYPFINDNGYKQYILNLKPRVMSLNVSPGIVQIDSFNITSAQ